MLLLIKAAHNLCGSGCTRMCAADTDCTQHHDPVEHVRMCASAQLILLLLGLLVQTYVHGQNGSCSLIQLLQLLHHCGCDTVQHIETSPARSQATSPGKKHQHKHHRHNTHHRPMHDRHD